MTPLKSRWTNTELLNVQTSAEGPTGLLPFTEKGLLTGVSGDLFGLSMDVTMLGSPEQLIQLGAGEHDFLIASTQGGLRGPNGENIASGLHIGHWELGVIAEEAARRFKEHDAHPFAVQVSDPCDGRTQGTVGAMDSLPYRNAAATVMGHLMRSAPKRKGVMGVATCDKGVPSMMMALAGQRHLPTIFVPGGVSLPTKPAPHLGPDFARGVNAGAAQSISTRFATGQIDLRQAQEIGCKACGTPGGGCQFLGTAATSQVVAEAMGMSLPHSALMPSGQPIWLDMGARSADTLINLQKLGITTQDIITDDAIHNAMVVHAAFGGSTNLLLHIPAIFHAAGLGLLSAQEWVDRWTKVNKDTPRLVDVLPNHPHITTIHAFMAGGVPEVMLHLRDLGLLKLGVRTVTGKTLGKNLIEWENSERRAILRQRLQDNDGINPDEVIYSPAAAKEKGLTSTVTFPTGNLTLEASVIKSTAIDPSLVGRDPYDPSKEGEAGVYHVIGNARVFTSEDDAMAAIKGTAPDRIAPIQRGDVIVLIGMGPIGMGMPETFQVTRALKDHPFGKYIPLLTDGRFSGVSTGACIGHIGPEALANGPIGKIKDGDMIEVKIDTINLIGGINFIGTQDNRLDFQAAAKVLAERKPHPGLRQHTDIPDDVKTWAVEQHVSGGIWCGCVRDSATITKLLMRAAMESRPS